jgi:hypothetical protein
MKGGTVEVDETVLLSLVSCRAFVRQRALEGDEEARTLSVFCDAIAPPWETTNMNERTTSE